ncbi:pentatricopeptide repeat-containing protein 2, mitochondrial isoform X3 [Marmota monax]|uniref:pentatricopeptide repeat-containing protein 2, mitochondrial isoform X2 n=1 Tax=Marmota flaviventris TaxID=93162 RepID=UPI000FFFACB9|nr:pentatricopeptide repeat-containing protein 2, mitochondrial isoform X3 [Marmota flaviventris]XP_046283311.1 pentatricopeptide repeat-containing protein 2, mitochondrial isoform X3 [Marmota monax]XP_048656110.1 pentatricopeptide repeat-containing protein 2, mitochondrial isoform X3 [Marmota marmota marmota]
MAAFRSLERALQQTTRTSFYPGVEAAGSNCCRCPLGAKRYLLTDNIMKLKEFQHKKLAIAYNLPDTKETYFRNLEEKLTQNKLILKDELRTLLHLCQTRDDVELAKNVMYRYHTENRNVTLGEYKFGPVFMRLCYELDLEESAVELIKDQHLHGFFSDSTSFNILMDMLFIKGKYKNALEVLIEMKNQDVKFTKDTYVLAFAICYKLNSPESFKICTTLREEALIKGDVLSRRASCFAVALALNQNQVAKAASIFSQIMNPENITCTNLNLVKVREKVKDDAPNLLAKFDEIYGKLHINGQVTTYTLDTLLCRTPRDKKSHTLLLNKRTISRRTFQPLSQSLLAE